MTDNPYLSGYSQQDILNLYYSGSITPTIDSAYNLILENTGSMPASCITIPIQNKPANGVKVETKYSITFTEL